MFKDQRMGRFGRCFVHIVVGAPVVSCRREGSSLLCLDLRVLTTN